MAASLPRFTAEGLLPPGEYALGIGDLQNSYLVTSEGLSPTWDSGWRRFLVGNLEILVGQLWQINLRPHFHRWLLRRG